MRGRKMVSDQVLCIEERESDERGRSDEEKRKGEKKKKEKQKRVKAKKEEERPRRERREADAADGWKKGRCGETNEQRANRPTDQTENQHPKRAIELTRVESSTLPSHSRTLTPSPLALAGLSVTHTHLGVGRAKLCCKMNMPLSWSVCPLLPLNKVPAMSTSDLATYVNSTRVKKRQ